MSVTLSHFHVGRQSVDFVRQSEKHDNLKQNPLSNLFCNVKNI